MRIVIEDQVPETIGITNALSSVDFKDTFATTNHSDSLPKIAMLIFGTIPGWVSVLFKVRNFFAKMIGLQTDPPTNVNTALEVGGYIGFFEIYSIATDEMILGANDTHLKFRVSIHNTKEEQYNIKVTTLVQYTNFTGKAYMFIIAPFHRMVVKRMLRQAYFSQKNR